MKKRIIGGTLYAVTFYLLLLINNCFIYFLSFIAFFGIYELFNIFKLSNKKPLVILYLISFLIYIYSMFELSENYVGYLEYFAAVIMLNDSFAYYVGKRIGRTKFSNISPNKTVEGLIGGFLFAPIVSIIIFLIVTSLLPNNIFIFNFSLLSNYNPFNSIILLYLFSIIICMVGSLGDLIESYFKRSSNIKDSGKIIYGHGGLLDRQDSLIFSAILIYLLFR